MGERPDDEVRRDPLDRPEDALGEGGRDEYPLTEPLVDPVVEEREVVLETEPYVEPEPYEPPRAYEGRETGSGAASGIMGTIRQNPLPAALTGIGLGWLLMNARSSGSSAQGRYGAGVYTHDYPPPYEGQGSGGPSPGQAMGRARDRVGETATQARDKVGETASQAQDRAGQVVGQAQDRVSRLGEQARYQAQRTSGGFQRVLRENPLTVGALALGAGAAVGLAIPQTTKEHEVMGEARDTLVEKAQEKAEEAQEKVQRVAEEAQSAAKEEAENQGLTQE
jgi:ElaB/YqjD/DUF883 family membrane-anchored ribosome-binding protein